MMRRRSVRALGVGLSLSLSLSLPVVLAPAASAEEAHANVSLEAAAGVLFAPSLSANGLDVSRRLVGLPVAGAVTPCDEVALGFRISEYDKLRKRRAPVRTLVGSVALAAFASGALACKNPPTCAGRGASSQYPGLVSYAFGGEAGTTMSGEVTVDDYVSSCVYDDEEFPIAVGGCELWAHLERGPEPAGRFFPGSADAWASIVPGQSCALPILGGTADATVGAGEIVFANATTGVFLSASAASSNADGGDPGGSLEWQFLGAGWPGSGELPM